MATTSTGKTQSPWWIAGVAGMASYLDSGAIVTTGTALVIYQKPLGITAGQIGQLSALLTIMIAIGALIGGRVGDQLGRRRVFTATLSLYAVGAVILALTPSVGLLYAGVVLIGFAVGADLPVSMAMIAETAPAHMRGRLVSFSQVLWMSGIVVVYILGATIGDIGEIAGRIMYAQLAFFAVLTLVFRFRLPESEAWKIATSSNPVVGETPSRWRKLLATPGVRSETNPGLRGLGRRTVLVPLVAVGLFYALENIAGNTSGQFTTFLYVNVAKSTVSLASIISLVGLALAFVSLAIMMRIVDTRYRMIGYTIAAVVTLGGFLLPAILGVTVPTLAISALLFNLSGNICGEPMFKVWSQELFPTTLRATTQGISIAFARGVAAVVALFTPAIIAAGPQLLYGFIVVTLVISFAIGLFWVARLPKLGAAELKAQEATPASASA